MKNFKIKVPNLELSKIIIEKLYSLGYKWVGETKDKNEVLRRAFDTYKVDLTIYSNVTGLLSYASHQWYTANTPYRNSPTISIEDLFTQVPSRVIDLAPGTTATIGENVTVKFGTEEYTFSKEQIKGVAALFKSVKLPDKFKIFVHTIPLAKLIESRLLELGYEWVNNIKTPLSDSNWKFHFEPGIYIRSNGLTLFHGILDKNTPVIQVSDLFKTKSVQLGEWEVTLDGDDVNVGCKTVKKDAVLKLIELCDTK